jgi:cbb3-type cytochrome oxidase subunit 3
VPFTIPGILILWILFTGRYKKEFKIKKRKYQMLLWGVTGVAVSSGVIFFYYRRRKKKRSA